MQVKWLGHPRASSASRNAYGSRLLGSGLPAQGQRVPAPTLSEWKNEGVPGLEGVKMSASFESGEFIRALRDPGVLS